MRNIHSLWPGQTLAPSSAYPGGEARNVSEPGDNSGTPYDARIVNDFLGAFHSVIKAAGGAPNNQVESADSSQFLDSLNAMYSPSAQQLELATWQLDTSIVDANPGAGLFRMSNALAVNTDKLFVNTDSANGLSGLVATVATGATIRLIGDSGATAVFSVSAPVQSNAGYATIPVDPIGNDGSLSALERVGFQFFPSAVSSQKLYSGRHVDANVTLYEDNDVEFYFRTFSTRYWMVRKTGGAWDQAGATTRISSIVGTTSGVQYQDDVNAGLDSGASVFEFGSEKGCGFSIITLGLGATDHCYRVLAQRDTSSGVLSQVTISKEYDI